MIVKKMPILQGFPDFETVKKLTKNHRFSERFVPLFYDIETTGLYTKFHFSVSDRCCSLRRKQLADVPVDD